MNQEEKIKNLEGDNDYSTSFSLKNAIISCYERIIKDQATLENKRKKISLDEIIDFLLLKADQEGNSRKI
ncbi:MAG: hypothetical protein GF332_04310 [Candidatus Moranbacteria bacterium]|nr:hypothetical protein [Candidatus Moranbacteria bacterium]